MSINEIRRSTVPQEAFPRQKTQRQDDAPEQSQGEPVESVEQKAEVKGAGGVLTPAEKSFFESLFPGAASEIRGHQAYTNNGQPPRQAAGTLIDRKG